MKKMPEIQFEINGIILKISYSLPEYEYEQIIIHSIKNINNEEIKRDANYLNDIYDYLKKEIKYIL